MKQCSKCRESKDFEFFSKNKNSKDGLKSACKECLRIDNRNYRKSDIGKASQINYTSRRREEIKDYKKLYYETNKSEILNNGKKYYEENKEYITFRNNEYKLNNIDKISKYQKLYYKENIEVIRDYKNQYFHNRSKTDIVFKLKNNISSLIRTSIKKVGFTKKSKSSDILGCDIDFFRNYIESKFEKWMTWENHGKCNGKLNFGWDIDHITPISTAMTEEDIIKLNHYTNLRPLCSHTNRNIKRDKKIDLILNEKYRII